MAVIVGRGEAVTDGPGDGVIDGRGVLLIVGVKLGVAVLVEPGTSVIVEAGFKCRRIARLNSECKHSKDKTKRNQLKKSIHGTILSLALALLT